MKRSILVTGVSGSGKSALSRKLGELGYKTHDMDDYSGLFTMIDRMTGKSVIDHDNASLERVKRIEWICNEEKLQSIINHESNDLAFYCGDATNLKRTLSFFDIIFLLEVDEQTMRKRLSSRLQTENDFGATKEVQNWLLAKKDQWETQIKEKGALSIDTHRSIDEIAAEIIQKVTKTYPLGKG